MIVEMAKVRVLGPRASLEPTVHALQDAELLQPTRAAWPRPMASLAGSSIVRRRRRHVVDALAAIEEVIATLGKLGAPIEGRGGGSVSEAQIARAATRLRRQARALASREQALVDERDALRAYEPLFADLDALLGGAKRVSAYLLRLHGSSALAELRAGLERSFGPDHVLRAHVLASGESVALLLVTAARAEQIDQQLAAAHVERAVLPAGLATLPFPKALPRMRLRLQEVVRELEMLRAEARDVSRVHGDELARARRHLHDELAALDAEEHAATTAHAFVLAGWIPAHDRARLADVLASVGPAITVENVARDEWTDAEAPVVLTQRRIFTPFQPLTSLLPLPRYGSVDPTPLLGAFFPLLFGVIVGDVGYGIALISLATVLRVASRRGTLARSAADVATAASVHAILFGVCYGEAFGDAGARWFGMRPIWFDRHDAIVGFLALALALGAAHLCIGLITAAANRWRRDRRQAIGRALTALMLVLLAVALLAALGRVPAVLAIPALAAVLAALCAIVILEGATAILEVISVVSHVLSYARIMALGTASVMLAIVANEVQRAFASLAVGVAFGLVLHLVNLAITLFSPTIQVMRLHYVEFFDTFFEPGGGPYRPLRHWSPEPVPR